MSRAELVRRLMDLIDEKLCIIWSPPANREAFAELVAAALEGDGQPVAVKVLEWVKEWGGSFEDIPEWSARTPFGTVSASVAGYRTPDGKRYERHEDVPEELKAKLIAKAEAAYEQRIRSALVASPPSPKLGVAVEALRDIANSDDVDNALDPARNKRVAREALSQLEKPGE